MNGYASGREAPAGRGPTKARISAERKFRSKGGGSGTALPFPPWRLPGGPGSALPLDRARRKNLARAALNASLRRALKNGASVLTHFSSRGRVTPGAHRGPAARAPDKCFGVRVARNHVAQT